jgi:hypothetical protein
MLLLKKYDISLLSGMLQKIEIEFDIQHELLDMLLIINEFSKVRQINCMQNGNVIQIII